MASTRATSADRGRPGVVAFAPPLVSDETLRSYERRARLLNGPRRSAVPFGPSRARWDTPDWSLPTGLNLVARTFGPALHLTEPRDWVLQHTLAPYFGQTMSKHARGAFESRLLEPHVGPRRPLLAQGLSEWFAQSAVLCPDCDEELLDASGFSVVRRCWLLPFVTRCPRHGTPLETFAHWSPEARGRADELPRRSDREDCGRRFAKSCRSLLSGDDSLLEQLGGLVQTRGFTSRGGRLRRSELSRALVRHAAGRYEHPDLDWMLSSADRVQRLLTPLWARRGTLHPAVAVALVDALRELPEVVQLPIALARPRLDRAALELALLEESTPTAAAKMAGVSVQTALVQARAMGLTVSSRAKAVKGPLVARLHSLLQDGLPVADVAHQCGVSVSTVYRARNSSTALARVGRDCDVREREVELGRRQQVWLALVIANPSASASELRAMAPADYAFLHRNARDWLRGHAVGEGAATTVRSTAKACRAGETAVRQSRAPEGADFAFARRIERSAERDAMCLPPRRTVTGLMSQAGRAKGGPFNERGAAETVLRKSVESQEEFIRRRLSAAAKRLLSRGQALADWRILREARLRPELVTALGVDVHEFADVARADSLKALS